MFVFLISSLILRSKIESVWHPFMRKGYGRRASVAEGNGAIAEPVVARPTLAAVAPVKHLKMFHNTIYFNSKLR